METYTLSYLGDLRVTMKHQRSGNTVTTDAPIDNEGRGEAFSPTDLVCASLGSCMITILGIIAKRNNISLEGLTANVSKIMNNEPRRIKEVIVEMNFPKADYSDKQKEIFKRAVNHCPVALSLHYDVKKTIIMNF